MAALRIAGLLFALTACGRAPGALPEITFTEAAQHCGLRAEGCRWSRSAEGKEQLRCHITKGGPTWVKALIWTAYDDRRQKVEEGGSGGLPWKSAGESRDVGFELRSSTRDRITRIEVDVL